MDKWRTDFDNLRSYDYVLLAIPQGRFDTVVVEGYRDEYGDWYLTNGCACCRSRLDENEKPSHFMPLPTAPKKAGDE